MAGEIQQLSESAVIRSFRRFRHRYFPNSGEVVEDDVTGREEPQPGLLDSLPVELQFLIMTCLCPADMCRLGATSRYWSALVRDPVLWRYFLLRDMPHWSSIDHMTMPQLELLNAPEVNEVHSPIDRHEGKGKKCDYMSEYLRACPSCRQQWLHSRPAYEVVTSFLQSLVPSSEPRFAMFGPGMEHLDVCLVTRLMHAPDVLPVSGTPHRKINGGSIGLYLTSNEFLSAKISLEFNHQPSFALEIGSGISFMFNNQHRFNILTMYSTNRAERERARMEQKIISSKLFTVEGADDSGCPIYSPAPQVRQVCQVVDGFIYVANAEPGRDGGRSEVAQIQAVLSAAWGSTSRPLLVLSCVSREEPEATVTTGQQSRRRTPCVNLANRLGLPQLANPWMVQDTVAESLSGLLDGITWLLKSSGHKLYGS